MREPVFADTVQVALVVRDLQSSLQTYVERYGIGPWEIYEFNPDTVENMQAHGEPLDASWRLALARVGNVMRERVAPLAAAERALPWHRLRAPADRRLPRRRHRDLQRGAVRPGAGRAVPRGLMRNRRPGGGVPGKARAARR